LTPRNLLQNSLDTDRPKGIFTRFRRAPMRAAFEKGPVSSMSQWTKQPGWHRGEDRRCRRAPSMDLLGGFAPRRAPLSGYTVNIGASGPPGNS
jgi:hypothetical protein